MELLKSLYEIWSPSGEEKKLKRFIKKWVANNIEGVECTWDNAGNLFFKKGESDTYPCLAAHLDQVQKKHSKDFKAVFTDDIVFGYSPSQRERQGLGADDKNGLWIALKALEEFDVLKVAFFVGEEIGCVGSGKADLDFFKDVRFVVQADRRGYGDFITTISCTKVASQEFIDDIDFASFGYKETSGMMTDVLELTERGVGVACINMSCGYYDPHTDDEYTVIDDLLNAYDLVAHIITNCTKVYEHTYEYVPSKYYGYYGNYGGYGGHGTTNKWGRTYDTGDWYDDDYKDWDILDKETSSVRYNEPILPRFGDYADVQSFIDQLIYQNIEDYLPEDLWPYVASDLEGFATEDEFLAEAYISWYHYANTYYGDDDDAKMF